MSELYRLKVAMVGPDSTKWTERTEQLCKKLIHLNLEGLQQINATVIPISDSKFKTLEYSGKKVYYPFTVISGHCPVGTPKYWCYDEERFVDIVDVDGNEHHDPPKYSGYGYQFSDIVYDQGGVDTWVEIQADRIHIDKQIFPAPAMQWNDKNVTRYCTCGDFRCDDLYVNKLRGYRSRNIQIAETAQVVLCYVPKVDTSKFDTSKGVGEHNAKSHYCFHCREWGHPTNGGCWTMQYAKKLGKETHLVIIE
jgi:hypothetical protein